MILEDIKYQLDQFYSFDNIRLSFEIADKSGLIYYNEGKITKAVFDLKEDIDAFRELKDLEGQINIQVSIGEPAPENTLDKSFDEIIELISEAGINEEDEPLIVKSPDVSDLSAAAEINTALVAKISEGLAKISGVEGILAVRPDGEVLYSKDVEDPDFESADSIFLYNQSKELGDILNFKNLKSTVCEAGNYKKIIINNKNILYSIKVSPTVQPLKTQIEAVKLLENA
ncbi:MAG: hypothetical protein EVJ47_01265 [Candidatus Acidulodesulfobacterium ferriphilum]|uniref:Roadblock/LC7 domain-containing protein n=1 Tax=Candidatus Acidulodesulfobacterium ferriphilum TaxID=2597223 RepID=A0A519BCE9_9DELT|nr:MAG: hypothetical protein EVJ47_01265 [Candidatus Acidulodesulfobacterium ferriphilum]